MCDTEGVGLDAYPATRKVPKELFTSESKSSGTKESNSEDDFVIAHHSSEQPSEGESNGEKGFEPVNELPRQTRSGQHIGASISKYREQFLYF